jgi:hypothetical protein
MPTRRKRSRKNRNQSNRQRNRRGGFLGIPGTKFDFENVNNCKNYWSDGKDPRRCEENSSHINYPGMLKKSFGQTPTKKGYNTRVKPSDY